MATIGIALTAQIAGLQELQTKLGETLKDNPAKTKILAAAIEKAILPLELRLREVTPLGPTGNLRRAVASKVVQYGLDGRAVGIVGYRRSAKGGSASFGGGSIRVGPDRAFHQWWLENGTKPRVVSKPANKRYTRLAHRRKLRSGKVIDVLTHDVLQQGGYIASSYNELQGFAVLKTPRLPRGQAGQRVQTEPALPGAFFKKSSTPVQIPAMPIGGSTGQPPVARAFRETQPRVAEILNRELRISLEEALNALSKSTQGSVT
jgi:hypothetical protein